MTRVHLLCLRVVFAFVFMTFSSSPQALAALSGLACVVHQPLAPFMLSPGFKSPRVISEAEGLDRWRMVNAM